MRLPKLPSGPASPERLKVLLLAAVAVLIVAYAVRVRPMDSETEEILISLESESAFAEPSVTAADAAYGSSAERSLSEFYTVMESHLSAAGLTVESRQARIESDPQFPAATLIYECRTRGAWPAVLQFLSQARTSKPRIRFTRMVFHRLEQAQQVELFFESRALALPSGGES